MIVLYVVLWVAIGMASFIYWWTRDLDFTSGEIPLAIAAACFGPLCWIMGWSLHGKAFRPNGSAIIKRRKP